jgi:hypothetical protein
VTLEEAFNVIADNWGGKGCSRHIGGGLADYGGYFVGDWGERFIVAFPGNKFRIYEDSGRPCGKITIPQGRIAVRGLDDAPDCWWYCDLNGEKIEYNAEGGE